MRQEIQQLREENERLLREHEERITAVLTLADGALAAALNGTPGWRPTAEGARKSIGRVLDW